MKNTVTTLVTTTTIGLICAVNSPQSAQATTLIYNLGGGNANSTALTPFTYTPVDLNEPILTVTGAEAGVSTNVRRRSDGLGVVGTGNKAGQVDGEGELFESLLLSFDQPVRIESASFTRLQNNDGFALSIDGDEVVSLNSRLNNNNPFDFSSLGNRKGLNFEFTVAQENDDYRLESVTVETVPETTPVLPLLGFGLVSLLFNYKPHKLSS
ncbi:conserved exported hypothetical protein [Hyella patelloides LEGE 07179]|uniref:PEP-CTERM sorting domain-containing protein n=1 Tax=Hyella patelloides LEGE 07179 TaxID=945734 RepID=A0A563VWC8_9CYAN|nr:hypothetical protein [Hyella patelloides]VEP15759.1 conserved exported hypothetical protein [Hyella patelloides LEGE 07179]